MPIAFIYWLPDVRQRHLHLTLFSLLSPRKALTAPTSLTACPRPSQRPPCPHACPAATGDTCAAPEPVFGFSRQLDMSDEDALLERRHAEVDAAHAEEEARTAAGTSALDADMSSLLG